MGADVSREHVRLVRRHDAARAAQEQRPPALLLQRVQLLGDGRLGEVQLSGRGGQRAGAVDGEEGAQQIERTSHNHKNRSPGK